MSTGASRLKATVARALFPYQSIRRVLRGSARGVRFYVEPGIGLSYAVGADAATAPFLEARLGPGMTVYDVGANKGQMALLFASIVGPAGRVVSIEPAPAEYGSLVRNLSLNPRLPIAPIRAAAAEKGETLVFTYNPDRPTQGKLRDVEQTYVNTGAVTFDVDAIPLDSLLDSHPPPDVLKVDVEGAAHAALKGATRILDEVRPNIYIELHGPEEQAGVYEELIGRGYAAETLTGEPVPDPRAIWRSPLWCRPGHVR